MTNGTTATNWPTYRGIDGNQHPMPTQTCQFCGDKYPGFMDIKYGHKDCQDDTQKRYKADAMALKAKFMAVKEDRCEECWEVKCEC